MDVQLEVYGQVVRELHLYYHGKRLNTVKAQDRLLARKDAAAVLQSARDYDADVGQHVELSRLYLSRVEETNIGWLADAITLGADRQALKELVDRMRVSVEALEQEKVWADQRVAALLSPGVLPDYRQSSRTGRNELRLTVRDLLRRRQHAEASRQLVAYAAKARRAMLDLRFYAQYWAILTLEESDVTAADRQAEITLLRRQARLASIEYDWSFDWAQDISGRNPAG
jgi:hypothetical protein